MSVAATQEASAIPASGADAGAPGRQGANNAPDSRADSPQVSEGTGQEQSARGPDYFRQAFNRIRGYTQEAASPPASASSRTEAAPPAQTQAPPETGQPAASGPAATRPAEPATTFPARSAQNPAPGSPAPQSDHLVMTREEFARQAQAEADRILAKRQAEDLDKAKRAREIELRRTDPFEYARLMEQREQELATAQQETERLTDVAKQQLFHYDRNVLDIFVSALPEADRPKVIAKDVPGIPGRKATAEATIKALRARWLAEGRASARADLLKDDTFIKEVLARFGATPNPEPAVSPTLARPAGAARSTDDGNTAMNDWMRSSARAVRSGV